ncbi:hypothetical protein, partial [Brevundimonas sp.]
MHRHGLDRGGGADRHEGRARTGVLRTPRGDIRTPAFMPV